VTDPDPDPPAKPSLPLIPATAIEVWVKVNSGAGRNTVVVAAGSTVLLEVHPEWILRVFGINWNGAGRTSAAGTPKVAPASPDQGARLEAGREVGPAVGPGDLPADSQARE